MYDAQQGSTSGAHIDMSTASGTNKIHGSAYIHRGTDWLNAAPFFYNADPNIPGSDKVPELHRYSRRRHVGRPAHQEQTLRLYRLPAPPRFRSGDRQLAGGRSLWPDRTTAAAAGAGRARQHAISALLPSDDPTADRRHRLPAKSIRSRIGLLNYKLPNGQYLIPIG